MSSQPCPPSGNACCVCSPEGPRLHVRPDPQSLQVAPVEMAAQGLLPERFFCTHLPTAWATFHSGHIFLICPSSYSRKPIIGKCCSFIAVSWGIAGGEPLDVCGLTVTRSQVTVPTSFPSTDGVGPVISRGAVGLPGSDQVLPLCDPQPPGLGPGVMVVMETLPCVLSGWAQSPAHRPG